MRKALLGLGMLAAVALIVPRAADAHVSVGIGLPGFGFFVGPPAYAPPVYYAPRAYYPPRVVYAPRYGYDRDYGYDQGYGHDRGCHRGWYKHDRDDDWGDRDDD